MLALQDFHGHSKKEGIFFYGGKAHAEDRMTNASIQLLPRRCASRAQCS